MKNNSLYFRPALFAGLIMAVINFAPGVFLVNCFCCAGLFIGGVLSVVFFRMDMPSEYIIVGRDGLFLGFWTAIFAAGFDTVFNLIVGPALAVIKLREIQALISGLLKGVNGVGSALDQTNQAISDLLDAVAKAGNPSLLAVLGSFVMILVIYSIFTIIGALLTTAIVQKRKQV